jgi:predicted methyltransferase
MPLITPPIVTSDTAKSMLEGKISVSIDLGLSKTTIKQTNKEYWLNKIEYIDKESLEKIAQDTRSIYFVQNKTVFMAAIGGKHFIN